MQLFLMFYFAVNPIIGQQKHIPAQRSELSLAV